MTMIIEGMPVVYEGERRRQYRLKYPQILQPHGLKSTKLLCPWDSPSKNTGVGCHFLLQGIFPIQGSKPALLYCRQTLYRLSHQKLFRICLIFCKVFTYLFSLPRSFPLYICYRCATLSMNSGFENLFICL